MLIKPKWQESFIFSFLIYTNPNTKACLKDLVVLLFSTELCNQVKEN